LAPLLAPVGAQDACASSRGISIAIDDASFGTRLASRYGEPRSLGAFLEWQM